MIIVHGLGEHSGRYGNPVSYFCPRGYAIYIMDNRGHGRSSGLRGHVDDFREYREDLASFIEKVRKEYHREKLFLVGHSLGGLISISYALSFPKSIQGLIISSPGLRPKEPPPVVKAFMGRILSHLWPTLTLSNEVDPHGISRDPMVVTNYINDPLVHDRVSTRFYTEFLKETVRVVAEAPSLRVPLLLMQAGEDRLVDPEASKEFFSRAGSQDKTLKIYEGYYHELFNEPEKEKVFMEIEQWIKERFEGRDSLRS
jgi:alpha-beta hydrolase superfamily lysophospholipase